MNSIIADETSENTTSSEDEDYSSSSESEDESSSSDSSSNEEDEGLVQKINVIGNKKGFAIKDVPLSNLKNYKLSQEYISIETLIKDINCVYNTLILPQNQRAKDKVREFKSGSGKSWSELVDMNLKKYTEEKSSASIDITVLKSSDISALSVVHTESMTVILTSGKYVVFVDTASGIAWKDSFFKDVTSIYGGKNHFAIISNYGKTVSIFEPADESANVGQCGYDKAAILTIDESANNKSNNKQQDMAIYSIMNVNSIGDGVEGVDSRYYYSFDIANVNKVVSIVCSEYNTFVNMQSKIRTWPEGYTKSEFCLMFGPKPSWTKDVMKPYISSNARRHIFEIYAMASLIPIKNVSINKVFGSGSDYRYYTDEYTQHRKYAVGITSHVGGVKLKRGLQIKPDGISVNLIMPAVGTSMIVGKSSRTKSFEVCPMLYIKEARNTKYLERWNGLALLRDAPLFSIHGMTSSQSNLVMARNSSVDMYVIEELDKGSMSEKSSQVPNSIKIQYQGNYDMWKASFDITHVGKIADGISSEKYPFDIITTGKAVSLCVFKNPRNFEHHTEVQTKAFIKTWKDVIHDKLCQNSIEQIRRITALSEEWYKPNKSVYNPSSINTKTKKINEICLKVVKKNHKSKYKKRHVNTRHKSYSLRKNEVLVMSKKTPGKGDTRFPLHKGLLDIGGRKKSNIDYEFMEY